MGWIKRSIWSHIWNTFLTKVHLLSSLSLWSILSCVQTQRCPAVKSVPPLLLQLFQLLLRTILANRLNQGEGELLLDVIGHGQLVCQDVTVHVDTVGGQVATLMSIPHVRFVIWPSLLWVGRSTHIHETTFTGHCIHNIDRITVNWVGDGVASSW